MDFDLNIGRNGKIKVQSIHKQLGFSWAAIHHTKIFNNFVTPTSEPQPQLEPRDATQCWATRDACPEKSFCALLTPCTFLPAGCEVTPDVNLSSQKYNIKLFVPSQDGLSEVWVRCEDVSAVHFFHKMSFLSSCHKEMNKTYFGPAAKDVLANLNSWLGELYCWLWGREILGSNFRICRATAVQVVQLECCNMLIALHLAVERLHKSKLFGLQCDEFLRVHGLEKRTSLFQEGQYAKWMAACRLASKGKTMADSSYESEVKSIQAFLNMQHPSDKPAISPSQINFQAEDFVAPRFLKKLKSKTVGDQKFSCLLHAGSWIGHFCSALHMFWCRKL